MIYIDFDGTISPHRCGEKLTKPPFPKCKETINALYAKGYEIIIYSCRANPDVIESKEKSDYFVQEMIDYLNEHGINFSRIEYNKPHYHVIIDDRAINCNNNWDEISKMFGE